MSKEQLLKDLNAAVKTAKEKLSAFELTDVPSNNYITQFGQKNLGEYLGYVASLKLGEEKIFKEGELEKLAGSADLTKEELENRKLFHYFLFELHRQKAASAAAAENQILAVPSSWPVEKHKGDLSEELVVGNWSAHYSETIGLRSNQEDAFVIGAAKQDGGWEDSTQVPSLLQKQFQEMGVQIRNYCIDRGEGSGSTAIAAHYSTDQKLTIANLGDSRAVLFVRKADGAAFEWIRLTNDQESKDVFERARIEAKGGSVWGNRVNGQLMVGRSFGDVFQEGFNSDSSCNGKMLISYEPDIYQHDIAQILSDYGANSQAFLMTSCDGMYEHGKGNEVTYAKALTDWFSNAEEREKHKNNMAEYLRDYAISLSSRDNVTVCISDITEAPQQSVVTAVFDGHAKSRVSAIAAEAFAQNVLQDRSAAVVHHADNSEEIRIIVEGRAAAVGVTESVALAKIQAQTGAKDMWETATPIEIEEVEVLKGGRAADSAEGGSLEKFKSSKDLARFIVERHAKFNFEEQGRFNKAFGLTTENPPSVENYIRAMLKVAPQKNVTDFLAEAASGAKGLQFGNDRSFHGAYHSIITTVYTGMFADFYSKHFAGKFGIPDGGLSEEQRNLAMVMTSAHDIARNTDLMSTDEHNNAFYLALILRDHFKLEQDQAIALASHIAKKDSPGDFAKKSIYSRLTQCADCAAIVRVYGSGGFKEDMLDARKDINEMPSSPEKSAAEADLKLILDFAKAFEDKMGAKEHAGYKVNNTTFDGATRYLRAVAKGISKDPTAGQKAFLGYLDGLSNEPKSEFISLPYKPDPSSQVGVEPYYDFISTSNEDLKKVPVALTGTVTVGWWQIAGGGMNGQMEGHLRDMGGSVFDLANAKLAYEGPKEKDGAENAIGTVQLLDLNTITGFKQDSQVQSILYSASPSLAGSDSATARAKMNAFGKKFRTQLSNQKIPELCLPLYSGGIYSGDHSQENVAEWLMEGWLAAEEESPAMEKVKVYLGHPCLVKAVEKLTKPAPEVKAEKVENSSKPGSSKEGKVPTAEADDAELLKKDAEFLEKILVSKPEDSVTVTAKVNLTKDHELRKKLLFAACKNNRFDLISICVANGSDISEKNDESQSPLDLVDDPLKRRIRFVIEDQEKVKEAKRIFGLAIHQLFDAELKPDKAMIAEKAKRRDAFAQAVLPPDIMRDLAGARVQLDTTEFLNFALDHLLPAENKVRLSSLVKSSKPEVEYKSESIALEPKLDITFSERQEKGGSPVRLSTLLNGFCKSEDMLEQEQPTIGGRKTPATKTLTPSVINRDAEIVMALRRNEKNGKEEAKKITDQVELDNVKFAIEGSEKRQEYEATSFIRHYGEAGGGHYVTYVKESDKKWYCYNDSWRNRVEDGDLKEAMKDAYVVKYTPLGDDPGTYRTPLPESQRSGTANAGNQCWGNGAFTFLLSMTSLTSLHRDLSPEMGGLDLSPNLGPSEKPKPAGVPKEDDPESVSLVSAILECEDGGLNFKSLIELLKTGSDEDRDSANERLLDMEMPSIEKAYANAAKRYLCELVNKFVDDGDTEKTEKIKKILGFEAFFSDEGNKEDVLGIIEQIGEDPSEDALKILGEFSGESSFKKAKPPEFLNLSDLCLEAISKYLDREESGEEEKDIGAVLKLLPHAIRCNEDFLAKATEMCLEYGDEVLTAILLERCPTKAKESHGEDTGGLDGEESDDNPGRDDESEEETPDLGSETEIEIEGMKAKSGGEIKLDLKDSKTGKPSPLVIKANENKFVEVVNKTEGLEVQIKSKEFREELMDYYKKKSSYEVGAGEKAKNIGKDALEVLNIYRAVPSTSVTLTSASPIVVGDLSKTR